MKRSKEPSLLRQIVAIHFEQAKRNKALRLLAKQEWSLEFLTAVVQKAGSGGRPVEIEVINKSGNRIIIRSDDKNLRGNDYVSDDIFNHLDDDTAVQKFIRDHTRR